MNYHIDLLRTPGKVTLYEDSGHWKSEVGGSVTYEAFLTGEFQAIVQQHFDAVVLEEVIEAVKKRLDWAEEEK